jgi:hypothetical protein
LTSWKKVDTPDLGIVMADRVHANISALAAE